MMVEPTVTTDSNRNFANLVYILWYLDVILWIVRRLFIFNEIKRLLCGEWRPDVVPKIQ